MEKFQRYDFILDTGTLIAAAFLTFLGFFGVIRITKIITLTYPVNQDIVDLGYNLVVFLVLLFTILNISFRFKEKSFQHWRAINSMTDFVTDIDNLLAHSRFDDFEIERYMSFLGYRYKHIIDILPPSTDRDYFRAKKSMAAKELLKLKKNDVSGNKQGLNEPA
jgi:hypothetical protein